MRARSNIPFEYADKTGKVDFIEILNSELIQAKIKCHSTHKTLMNEWMSLVWKTEGNKIILPKKEHPALPNHLCDAMLYAWRHTYTYHSAPAKPVIPVGSKQWYIQQSDNIWERERQKLEEQLQQGDWPEEPGWSTL
jgi:hypothetical protein